MISVWVGKDKEESIINKKIIKDYLVGKNLEIDKGYIKELGIKEKSLIDIICIGHEYVDETNRCVLNNTKSRESIVENNLKLLRYTEEGMTYESNMRTITTKQDRDPCAGLIEYPNNIERKLNYRYLTPRECFLGMGFDHEDYQVLVDNNFRANRGRMFFNDSKIYKMEGNRIVVNVLEAIFKQIYEIKDVLEK